MPFNMYTFEALWGVKTEAGRSPAEALPQDDGAGYLLMNARSGLYLTAAEEFDGAATLEDYGGEARTGQVFRLRAGYFPEKESSQSSPGLRARTQESISATLALAAGAVPT